MARTRERRNGSADILRVKSGSQRTVIKKGRNSAPLQSQKTKMDLQYRQMIVIDGNLYYNTALQSNILLLDKIRETFLNIKSSVLVFGYIKASYNGQHISHELLCLIMKYYGNEFSQQKSRAALQLSLAKTNKVVQKSDAHKSETSKKRSFGVSVRNKPKTDIICSISPNEAKETKPKKEKMSTVKQIKNKDINAKDIKPAKCSKEVESAAIKVRKKKRKPKRKKKKVSKQSRKSIDGQSMKTVKNDAQTMVKNKKINFVRKEYYHNDYMRNGKKKLSEMDNIINEMAVERENSEEKKLFDEKRQFESEQLFDGCFSESESQLSHKCYQMTLNELLAKFNINSNKLFRYYSKTLKIESANDFVNHSPHTIIQPKPFQSTKIRILLAKMRHFIITKIRNGEWNGSKALDWLKLEKNTFYYVFGEPISQPSLACENKNKSLNYLKSSEIRFEETQSNTLEINESNYGMSFVEKRINISQSMQHSFNISVRQLPDIDSREHYSMIVGFAFYNYANDDSVQQITDENRNTVYMCNRCRIYKNETYLTLLSMRNHAMIESGSEIVISINGKRGIKKTVIKFEHMRNGELVKYNERDISVDIRKYAYAKLFIKQVYGNGIYSVYELFSNKKDETPEVEIESKVKKKKRKPKRKKKTGRKKVTKETLSVTRKELLKLSKLELVKECKKYNVSIIGSKADMCDRLLSL